MKIEYVLNDSEIERMNDFVAEHRRSCDLDVFETEYIIAPVTEGTCISIRCGICGEEYNITDFNRW